MRNLKLAVTLGVIGTLLLLLAACGSDPTPTPKPKPTATPVPAAPTATAVPAAKPKPKATVAPKPKPKPTATPKPKRDMAKHFGGKTIRIVVPTEPAGGYDLMARFLTRFAPKHFPGKPKFIVQNLGGAGGLRGHKYMMAQDADGLTTQTMVSGLIKSELVNIDIPQLDLKTIKFVGSPTWVPDDYMICADRNVVSKWEDAWNLDKPLNLGSTSPGGRVPMGAHFVELAGGPMKVTFGYSGTTATLAAIERGETSASTCIERRDPRYAPEMVKDKRWVPLFWWNEKPKKEFIEKLGGPDPYHIFDLPGMKYTKVQKDTFTAVATLDKFLRMYVLHPDTPADIHEVWKKGFAATINDKEFINAAKVGGYTTGLGAPKDFVALFPTIRGLPPEGIKLLQQLLGKDS